MDPRQQSLEPTFHVRSDRRRRTRLGWRLGRCGFGQEASLANASLGGGAEMW